MYINLFARCSSFGSLNVSVRIFRIKTIFTWHRVHWQHTTTTGPTAHTHKPWCDDKKTKSKTKSIWALTLLLNFSCYAAAAENEERKKCWEKLNEISILVKVVYSYNFYQRRERDSVSNFSGLNFKQCLLLHDYCNLILNFAVSQRVRKSPALNYLDVPMGVCVCVDCVVGFSADLLCVELSMSIYFWVWRVRTLIYLFSFLCQLFLYTNTRRILTYSVF